MTSLWTRGVASLIDKEVLLLKSCQYICIHFRIAGCGRRLSGINGKRISNIISNALEKTTIATEVFLS